MTHVERTHSFTFEDDDLRSMMNNDQDQQELKTFDYIDYNSQDPDNNFFYTINNNCRYYTDDQYNKIIKSNGKLSIIHFNSRSLYANFNNIKDYLHRFSEPFNIIAISETWINSEKGMDFELDGYELGGGVAIYVDKTLNFKVLENMTAVVDNLLECNTIELYVEKSKNVISCIYRALGSNIEQFMDWMECMFTKKKAIKTSLYVGISILTY